MRTLIKEKLPVAPFLRDKATFDLVSWDDPNAAMPTPAHLTPQSAINLGLKKPSECDIVIVILWSRLGTPLSIDEYKKDDGTPYLSGTDWEFTDALTAARRSGSPTILVYRRTEIPQYQITLTDEELQDRRLQWGRVAKFFEQFRHHDGSIVGGMHEYKDPADFSDLLNQHLQVVVRGLLETKGAVRVPMMAPEPTLDFVARPTEFFALKNQLLDTKGDNGRLLDMGHAVAITAALRGAGGYGKTTLAKALAHDPDIRSAYFDGILWVELGQKPDNLLSIISDLITRLTGVPPGEAPDAI